jgi:hypothetical protein
MKVRDLIREPLLQFILLGVVLFGLYYLLRNESPGDDRRIVISSQQVDQLSAIFQKQWMRPPTEGELQGMLDGFVREEVLYREAKSLGLDRDDSVVRRRLAQKIEFLAQDLATQVEPSDSELETFFKEHPDLFREPPRISFEHVYVSVDSRGAEAAADAEAILAALRSGADPSEQGDRFMLQRRYIGRSPDEVARHFGRGFAEELLELPTGEWVGPVESGYGLHLVFIEGVEEAFLPDFAEIRPEVRDEYFSFRRREVDEQFYSQLREGYEVVIETPGEETEGQAATG